MPVPAGASVVVGHAPGGETFEHTLEPGRPLALEGLLAAELVETPAHIVGEGVESAGKPAPSASEAATGRSRGSETRPNPAIVSWAVLARWRALFDEQSELQAAVAEHTVQCSDRQDLL